ncbi:phage tail spike protein [Bacillus sp. IBL03825]|uniref:phage tail spike protein n=1 Tax=Bacillus sp. IBL03825 TaxID=2953580 RepID=UPI0021577032|nr:phage tail spike protein [Bacillus sp. IBL03825]MCR6845199.1 tail fiber domain-containing protein [Bacillus sp. IBL03825]
MRTPSGELHVVDFKTEQIVASIQPTDYWDDKRHWEIKNNIDTLEFRVFDNTRHSSTLMQQNLVLKEVRDGRIVPYVITEIEKNSDDRSVIAYASGEWIQLAKAGIIPPQKLEGKTLIEMMDIALAGTKWKKGNLEYASFRSMTIDEFIDPLSFLKKIASLFELEIQYRAEVVGSQIVGRYVDMVKKRGRETGKEITLGKDLMGIKRIENSQNICTALLGFVKKEGEEFVTITEINGGVPYLVDSDAFQRWNEKGQHKFGFYSPETENEDMDPKRLMTLMKTELQKRVNTSVSYEVEAQSIGRVFGLAHELINEGDTIRIKDTGFTPKLYLEARAIAGDESFKNPLQDKYVFGDYHEIIDPNEELRKLYNKILGSLGSKASKETLEQLEKLAKEAKETANNSKQTADDASAAAQIAKDIADAVLIKQKDFQTKIIKSTTPPSNPIKDLTLWLDISNSEKPILYLWNGTKWDRLTPDTSIIDADIKGIEEEIKNLQIEVGSKVNQQWVKEQIQTDIQNKADIKDVYKKTEIDKALEGHVKVQSYEIDKKALQEGITNNANIITANDKNYIKRFTENESKITQTEKEIKTQIEELSVTNKKVNLQGNTIDEVQKKTNEIVQDANGTKQTITEIQTTMQNQLATSRNLLDNSDFEADLEGWKLMGGANVKVTVGTFAEVNNSEMPGFNKYVKIERTGETGDIWFYKDLQTPLGDGIISMWARSQTNDSKSVPALGVKDNADGLTGQPGVKYFISNVPGEMRDGKWYQFHLNCKIEHGKVRVYFGQRQGTPVGSAVYITGVKLAQGNMKDNWSKSPGDITTNTEFKKKTAEIITSVDKVSSTLTETNKQVVVVEKKADTANEQITTTIKKVSDVSQTVDGLKVNVSDISKIQQGHTTEIQQQSSKIEANAKAIQTKVDSQFVEEYTGGLGSTQLLRDAEFTDGFKYWYKSNNANFTAEVDATNLYNGSPSMRLQGVNQTANVSTNVTSTTKIPVTPGEKITASVALFTKKLSEHINPYLTCAVVCWDSNNQQLTAMGWNTKVADNTWTKTSHTVTVPDTAVRMELRVYVTRNGELWFSKPMLQRGEVASYFTLHPKDYTDYDKLVDDIASRVLTEDYDKKMTQMNTQFTQTSKALELKAEARNVYTKDEVDNRSDAIVETMNAQFNVQAFEINSRVTKGSIISSINQTAETIKIQAGKIELDGTTIAKYLEAQELKGTTIRTDNGVNYVHIQKQFIRLMESNVSRVYLGYYKDRTSQIQPTVVLGGDSDFQDGSVVLSKQPTQGFLGVINGKDSNGDPYFVSSVIFKRSGDLNLNAGMNGNVTVKSGIGINHYAQGGSYWVEATGGIGLKGGNKNVLIDSRTAIIFSLKDKNMLDVVDYNGDTDLRFQTLTLRNGPSSYAGKLQVKSGSGTSFSPVVASNFETSSQRKYKTNIRDVQFSALEKIMALNIQQYNLKTDMEQLYEMRMNRQDNDSVLTTNDIQTRYGWIADDESNPECFVTKEKNAAEIYSSIALQIKAFQEEKHAKDAEIEELKEENKQMNRRIEVLEQLLVQNLIDKKPEQL